MGSRSSHDTEHSGDVRIPRAEQLVIEACSRLSVSTVLCTSLGWGQLALSLARRLEGAQVVCHFLDLYPMQQAQHMAADEAGRVQWVCAADFPPGPFQLAAVPVSRYGEGELTRDLLQEAHLRLQDRGLLVTAVDNPQDKWLHAEMKRQFAKVTREPQPGGVVYRAVRRGPPRRRDFRCEFAFRDRGRLVRAVSRPGVFSHRHLDLGARALLETMEVKAGDRVVDIGCGSGVVGLAAALRAENVFVEAIDSNARAIECTLQGAVLNGISIDDNRQFPATAPYAGDEVREPSAIENRSPSDDSAADAGREAPSDATAPAAPPGARLKARLEAEGTVSEPGTFDLVTGNPPYYSHYQIAEIFLQAARRALRPGGRVLIVTRKDEWHQARMSQLFSNVTSREVRGYRVVSALQRG